MDQTVAAMRAVSQVLHGAMELLPNPAVTATLAALNGAAGLFVSRELYLIVAATGRRR